ncbi:hypothetical protein [Longimicrobium terrae]|uniref:Lipoprotein n=1 Tax=Longimicrobium terrae TaxID=1639882 RepID=A0A841H5H8_9BACT|nr:hypothetical protein [Longimicrobium terrae]MBB4639062.1 hypothetical protein [Longimicrobium terrae]MBB6073337.1 hypothetical protein [Longimicrobium terrae]NNC28776.1 hypothetical protein [Longimicrobium terrae]
MKTTIRLMTAGALASILLAGCDALGLDEDWERRQSQAVIGIEGAEIYTPQTVRAGAAFPVQIYTVGRGCMRRGGTEVQVNQQAREADLNPYDYQRRDTQGCTEDFRRFEHRVQLTFDQPGTATINVHLATPDGIQTIAPFVVTRAVQVVP